MSELGLQSMRLLGLNTHYVFVVALMGSRWVGGAIARVEPGEAGRFFVFPEVSQAYELGLEDLGDAIALTVAVALDPESSYGGIDKWFIPPEDRGDPAAFRCDRCHRLHIPSDCEGGPDMDWYDD